MVFKNLQVIHLAQVVAVAVEQDQEPEELQGRLTQVVAEVEHTLVEALVQVAMV